MSFYVSKHRMVLFRSKRHAISWLLAQELGLCLLEADLIELQDDRSIDDG